MAGLLPGENAQIAKALLGTAKTGVAVARPMVPVAWKGAREAVRCRLPLCTLHANSNVHSNLPKLTLRTNRACLIALLRTQAALLTVAQLYAQVRQSVGVSVGTSTSTPAQEQVTVAQTVVVASPLT
jgi:hypothetical protein